MQGTELTLMDWKYRWSSSMEAKRVMEWLLRLYPTDPGFTLALASANDKIIYADLQVRRLGGSVETIDQDLFSHLVNDDEISRDE